MLSCKSEIRIVAVFTTGNILFERDKMIKKMLLSKESGLMDSLLSSIGVSEEDTVSKSLLYLHECAGKGRV